MADRYIDRLEILAAIEVDPIVDPVDPPEVRGRRKAVDPDNVASVVGLALGDYEGREFYHADIQHDLHISRPTENELTTAMEDAGLITRIVEPEEVRAAGRPPVRFLPTPEMEEFAERVPAWRDKVGLHKYMSRRDIFTESGAISELIRLGLMMTDPDEEG